MRFGLNLKLWAHNSLINNILKTKKLLCCFFYHIRRPGSAQFDSARTRFCISVTTGLRVWRCVFVSDALVPILVKVLISDGDRRLLRLGCRPESSPGPTWRWRRPRLGPAPEQVHHRRCSAQLGAVKLVMKECWWIKKSWRQKWSYLF